MEPEMCVLFNVSYTDGLVESIEPLAFTTFNDCSIRKPNAKQVCDALRCSGPHARYTEGINVSLPLPGKVG